MDQPVEFVSSCPIPISDYPRVLLAHGGGGTLMHQLLERMILPGLAGSQITPQHDSAVLEFGGRRLAFTTDSFVVDPLFFPGGDIGSLAVHGTVNDLAMSGATPLYLSAGFIIEEGLAMETLWRVVQSMKSAADHAGVRVVTGDTKVVDRGKGDGIFINTAGVGVCAGDARIEPGRVQVDDVVLVSGDLGRHGMAIMAQREGLEFESTITSDSAPLAEAVRALLSEKISVHCLRDLTRGGLASALNEIAGAVDHTVELREKDIPVREDVRAACEILGFDPLYVACEGRFVVFCEPADAARALAVLREHDVGRGAQLIGRVVSGPARVSMVSRIGAPRIVNMLSGEQLPRIC